MGDTQVRSEHVVTETREQTRPTDELARMVNEQVAALAGQLAASHTEAYQELLRFYGQFHEYSVNNVLLIFQQCPQATRVASYRRWQQLGRQVAKGSRSIKIWCPVLRKTSDETTGEEVEIPVGFRPGRVFDASQLVDIQTNPLPSLFRPLPDDDHADFLYRRAVDRLAQAGIEVIEQPLPPGVQGASEGGTIRLRWRLDPRSRLLVLIHELAHELAGHQATEKPVAQRELEAESTSFVVAAILGLEHPFSQDYLIGYEVTPDALSQSLATIQTLVRAVLPFVTDTDPSDRHHQAA